MYVSLNMIIMKPSQTFAARLNSLFIIFIFADLANSVSVDSMILMCQICCFKIDSPAISSPIDVYYFCLLGVWTSSWPLLKDQTSYHGQWR